MGSIVEESEWQILSFHDLTFLPLHRLEHQHIGSQPDYYTPPRGTMEIMLPKGHIMRPKGCIMPPEGCLNNHYKHNHHYNNYKTSQ